MATNVATYDWDSVGKDETAPKDSLWPAGQFSPGTSQTDDDILAKDPVLPAIHLPVGAAQLCPCSHESVRHDSSVDVDGNDLLNMAGFIVNLPLALLIRGSASVYSPFADALMSVQGDQNSPMQSKFGTGDHSGLGGALFGDNSALNDEDDPGPSTAVTEKHLPGVLGIAMGLAHSEGIWGNSKIFEDGQKCHNLKTGNPEQKFEFLKSAGDTIGEGLGIIAKHLHVGDEFYGAVHSLMGDSENNYGFVSGVRNGAVKPGLGSFL